MVLHNQTIGTPAVMNSDSGITLEVLSATKGHAEIFIRDDDPAERAKLAAQIQELIKNGHAVFLVQGEEARLIREYDSQTNEWVVAATPQEAPPEAKPPERRSYRRRISAGGSSVTSVPPMAGG